MSMHLRSNRQKSPAYSFLYLVWAIQTLGLPCFSATPQEPPSPLHFVDVAANAGITRVVHAGRPGKDHLLDSAGTGAAWLDYDRDGFLDAYIVNSWRIVGTEIVERGKNALYRNRGDGTFEDVTDTAGVTGEGHWGAGVAVADVDQDGWVDILVTNFGPNLLYRNRGDGMFEEIADSAGIASPGWNTGAAFFDAEGDGDLDLFIAGYIATTTEEVLKAKPELDWKGVDRVATGPFGLPGAPDHFFISDGKGNFQETTDQAGMKDQGLAFGFAVRAADFDRDGDLDLYVANDSDPNYLYRNEGGGRFKEIGLWSGAALDSNGAAQAGMGLATGDVDGDTITDIVVANFSEDYTTLYRGLGDGFFEDISNDSGVGAASFNSLSWGTALVDLDNDMDLDLVIANGHIYPQVDRHPELGFSYRQRNLVLANNGKGQFVDVTDRAGPGFALEQSSRGLAAGDFDNDGDLDLLIVNLDEPPNLLRNDSAQGNWLTVIIDVPARMGPSLGTQVSVEVGGRKLHRDLASSDSYVSSHDPRLHFGLGQAKKVDRLVVRWPDGSQTQLEDIDVNRFLTVQKEAPSAQ